MSDFESREQMEHRHSKLPDEEPTTVGVFREEIDADFATMLIPVDTVGELPAGVSVRANGVFDDPMACFDWLLGWGCSMDVDGNPVPNGLVYAVRTVGIDDQIEYHIYVADDSP